MGSMQDRGAVLVICKIRSAISAKLRDGVFSSTKEFSGAAPLRTVIIPGHFAAAIVILGPQPWSIRVGVWHFVVIYVELVYVQNNDFLTPVS